MAAGLFCLFCIFARERRRGASTARALRQSATASRAVARSTSDIVQGFRTKAPRCCCQRQFRQGATSSPKVKDWPTKDVTQHTMSRVLHHKAQACIVTLECWPSSLVIVKKSGPCWSTNHSVLLIALTRNDSPRPCLTGDNDRAPTEHETICVCGGSAVSQLMGLLAQWKGRGGLLSPDPADAGAIGPLRLARRRWFDVIDHSRWHGGLATPIRQELTRCIRMRELVR